jgi:formylglycine-generating enzyme required for sulfatase activity
MPRLQRFFECVANALCDTAGPGSADPLPIADSLLAVARSAHQHISARFTDADLRVALREAVAAPQETVDLALEDAVAAVAANRAWIKRNAFMAILELIQPTLRQVLRRPGDIAGTSVPQQLPIGKPDDWLILLPDRMPRFAPGDVAEAYDNWRLIDLRGFGTFGEVWHAQADGAETASLKFITDPRAAADFARHETHFRRILALDPPAGLNPLRSVYLLADPPCLESALVSGYDLAGLVRDWRWRDEGPKPDQAAMIVRRIAKIVGHLHLFDPPVVHRGLKPSNILLHPTAEGKVTIWVADIGWGEISAALALERTEQAQTKRQARRGALAALYASPEQQAGQPPSPRDDVYALGVIWHQLLKRDVTAPAPEGHEWALEFRKEGLTDSQARLLASCIDANPVNRPANGADLAAQIGSQVGKSADRGPRVFNLKDTSEVQTAPSRRQGESRQANLSLDRPQTFKNSFGMEFVLIEPGEFEMGSSAEEKGRRAWEGPQRVVTLTRPFYLGVYPVTQEEFQQICGWNPSYFTRTRGGGPNHPVEQTSWDDAVEFCRKLMEVPDESAAARIYRLPTEAEWEFACRAGTKTPYAFGLTVTLNEVHFFGLSAATWAKSASSAGKTSKVDARSPNAWGLHDLHGNVLEWCHDWWSEKAYEEAPAVDPPGPAKGVERVVRGGSFSQFASECRSAARAGRAPASRLNIVGFRVAVTIPGH